MDSASTAWTLACAALVLLMTPGLAFFYCGLVRSRAVINTMKMSFVAMGIIALAWALLGYSLAFAPGNSLIGGLSYVGLMGVTAAPEPAFSEGIPHLAFMVFQMMFAIITPALISGAVVGRMKFKSYTLFILLWSLFAYAPLAHWVWGPGGWIAELGALDFAGGTVVHVSAGVAALVAALVLGPRRSQSQTKLNESERPHNIPFVILGASLLWFGWFGFNAGSALAADGIAAVAFVNTMLAASSAVMAWIGLELFRTGRPTATGAAIGAVVGLVTITPAAGFVSPLSSIIIGAVGALGSFAAMRLLASTKLDDTLDVFACHGVGGIIGSLLTGVFASTTINPDGAPGLIEGNGSLLVAQGISVLAAGSFTVVATLTILLVVRAIVGLRTSPEVEEQGIDVAEHAEGAYDFDTVFVNDILSRPELLTT